MLEHLGEILESNRISISIQLCPFGHALEADIVSYYKCIPCRAGAFANLSEDSLTQCSKCLPGKSSNDLLTFCLD